MPGNVRLRKGEANLERASVVNVSQLRTMDRARLVDSIGVVSPSSMRDVLLGIALVFGLDDPDIAR
jgi:mRNA interferase MazF